MSVQAMMATILQNLEWRGVHSLPSSDHEAIIEPSDVRHRKQFQRGG